jgi:hypothetical protein
LEHPQKSKVELPYDPGISLLSIYPKGSKSTSEGWIKKVWYIHNEMLSIHKEEQNHVVCRKMNGNGDHSLKQNESDSKTSIVCFLYMESSKKDMKVEGEL